MKEIPVYLATGFLESGKTSLISEMLTDREFLNGEKVLVICTEQGPVSYDENEIKAAGAEIVYLEDENGLTVDFFNEMRKKYKPDLAFIELNGMWQVDDIYGKIPKSWPIAQIFTTIDATSVEMYLANMRSLIMNIVKLTDCIIFNRCTSETNKGSLRRIMRAANPRASVIFEDIDGKIDNDVLEEVPYDTDGDKISLEEGDFGIFYLDATEHPERYEGKELTLKVLAYFDDQMPEGQFYGGRYAMTCCEADVQYIGVMCKNADLSGIKPLDAVMITGRFSIESNEMYNEPGPVIDIETITKTSEPREKYVYFN